MYRDHVNLLLEVLTFVAEEKEFALKGGTGINLFQCDMPRYSVDIDLTYLPFKDRHAALDDIRTFIRRLKDRLKNEASNISSVILPDSNGTEARILCQRRQTRIKVEVNTTMRGHLFPTRILDSADQVKNEFQTFLQVQVVSQGELYGGKLCAALDRQHPRDLFDVAHLLRNKGITDEIRIGFLASLLSHPRPIQEILFPNLKDQTQAFKGEFAGMALSPFSYDDYCQCRQELIHTLHRAIKDEEKQFLLAFKNAEPD